MLVLVTFIHYGALLCGGEQAGHLDLGSTHCHGEGATLELVQLQLILLGHAS